METLASSAYYYSDEMDHSLIFDQWEDLNAFDDHLEMVLEQDQSPPSSESYSASYPSPGPPAPPAVADAAAEAAAAAGRPRKMARTARSWSVTSCTTDRASAAAAVLPADASGPRILSFGNPAAAEYSDFYAAKPKEEVDVFVPGVAAKRSRSPSHNKEHIMAERKRREKLSQRFIALSAIVPGLKKMDKASVLGDAIKYLKQLQERVVSLEERAAKRNVESVVLVKKSQLCAGADDDDGSSTGDSFFDDDGSRGHGGGGGLLSLPEIEAKICERSVLIKIHCENQKTVLVKALSEIEKLHLSVSNTSVIPFTSSSIDITVMTQMEEGFSMTAKDLVKKLNSAFRQIMQ